MERGASCISWPGCWSVAVDNPHRVDGKYGQMRKFFVSVGGRGGSPPPRGWKPGCEMQEKLARVRRGGASRFVDGKGQYVRKLYEHRASRGG
jgi:hypothetical protein